jgi:hypothetical protein
VTTPAPPHTGPSWCTSYHAGEHPGQHAHTTAPTTGPIETIDPRDGQPGILFIDVEQTDADTEPRIILHGTAVHEVYTLADAERIACDILAQVMAARAGTVAAR